MRRLLSEYFPAWVECSALTEGSPIGQSLVKGKGAGAAVCLPALPPVHYFTRNSGEARPATSGRSR